jgi:hypothetical protein
MRRRKKSSRPARSQKVLLQLRRADALAREARTLLREAGALRSYEKAKRLLASIGGAIRHAERLQHRPAEPERP